MNRAIIYIMLLTIFSCQNENQAPICSITNPSNGEEIEIGETITITASAEDSDGTISKVSFYFNGSLIGAAYTDPYSIEANSRNKVPGTYKIKAIAKDDMGDGTPHEITVIMVNNLPLVLTHPVGEISSTAAIGGGIVTGEGGDGVTAKGVCWSTETIPTLENKYTTDGIGMGIFSSYLIDLVPQTIYYVRAYATNSFGTAYGQEVEFTTDIPEPDPIVDIDGNSYKTTQIGSQLWMAENLRVVHYSDGTPIPLITDNNEWKYLGDNNIDKAYCWYDNDRQTYAQKYGALYTYAAAVDGTPFDGINHVQGACPAGWHVPSHHEWAKLLDNLGSLHSGLEALALKSKSGWIDNGNGTDNFGFNALPGGICEKGVFRYAGKYGNWWNSDDHFSPIAYYFHLSNHRYNATSGSTTNKSMGYSVRCLKD